MHIQHDLLTIPKLQYEKVKSCPHRLTYHAMAPYSWINDPNGFVQFRGEYHLFFQFNPEKPVWGRIHWGHYRSKDMIRWEYLPIALSPEDAYDKDGCFSGTAIEKDDRLHLCYTGHVVEEGNITQTQCLATSKDGIIFEKYSENPVLDSPPEGSNPSDFRDPMVWREGDQYYMVVGSCNPQKDSGQILLYRSKDLLHWEYMSTTCDQQGSLGYMWECPCIVRLGGRDILIFSPQGIESQGELYQNNYQSGYVVGDMDRESGVYQYGDFCELDRGFDFYAPQTTMDDKGRCIMIGWMEMWETEMPTQKNLWAGAMTLPRELALVNGKIKCYPIKEIEDYRVDPKEITDLDVRGKLRLDDWSGDTYELYMEIRPKDVKGDVCIALRASEDEAQCTRLIYDESLNRLTLDRRASGIGPKGQRHITLDEKPGVLTLRIFVDRSSVEVFVGDGDYVMTARVYPDPESVFVDIYGEARIKTMRQWEIKA